MGTGNNIMIVWLDYEDGDSYVKEAAVAQAGGEAKYISAAQVKSAISATASSAAALRKAKRASWRS